MGKERKILLKGYIERSDLGLISEKFETGGRGPEAVSSGKLHDGTLDSGGPSYGPYQLTSQDSWRDKQHHLHIEHNGGNVAQFLKTDGAQWADEFKGMNPGSKEFTDRWKEVARANPEAITAAEQTFIGRTHFQPQVDKIQKETGLDVTSLSTTAQNVVWSTAVQHGANWEGMARSINEKARESGKSTKDLTDLECIDAIYAERIRTNPSDSGRYKRENQYAREMLEFEERSPQSNLRGFVESTPGGTIAQGDVTGGNSQLVPTALSETLRDTVAQAPIQAAVETLTAILPVPQSLSETLSGREEARPGGQPVEDSDPEQNPQNPQKDGTKKKKDSQYNNLNPDYPAGGRPG